MTNIIEELDKNDIRELISCLIKGKRCEFGFTIDGTDHSFDVFSFIMVDRSRSFYKNFKTKVVMTIYNNVIYLNKDYIIFKRFIKETLPKIKIVVLSEKELDNAMKHMVL